MKQSFAIPALLTLFLNAHSFAAATQSNYCADALVDRTTTIHGFTLPLHELEEVPKNEPQAIVDASNAMVEYFRRAYSRPQVDTGSGLTISGTRRGVHPKSHGLIQGTFTIAEDLDPVDRVGVFQPGRSYPVIFRFSNADPRPNGHDKNADSRGVGMKIMNVIGEHVLPDGVGSNSSEQDITFNSSDTFFAHSAKSYADFFRTALLHSKTFGEAATKHIARVFATGHPLIAARILKAFQKIQGVNMTNPLALPYFSISAFQHGLGPHAPVVKYAIRPCNGGWTESVDINDPNFLRHNLERYITQNDACFEFLVQHRTRKNMQIEDLTRPWSTEEAPFKVVGVIRLPKQSLMDEALNERMVFNPWNSLKEHRPLGGINRIRLDSYLTSIEHRRRTNP